MPRLVTGNFVDKIISAVWVSAFGNVLNSTTNVATGDGQACWIAPAKCILLAADATTGTAQVIASAGDTADSTGFTVQLRCMANSTGVDMFGTALTLTAATAVRDGVLISTQTSLVVTAGRKVYMDVDAVDANEGPLVVQAYFYGV